MKKIFNIILLLLITLLNLNCHKKNIIAKTIYLDEAFSVIPIVTILDYEHKFTIKELQQKLSQITNNLDIKFNVFNETSLISQVNKNAGIKEVKVDNEFIYIIKKAMQISIDTKQEQKALYDITIYPIWKEWKFNENYYQYYNYSNPPSDNIIKQKLPLVNYENIQINEQNKTIFLKHKNMAIDLGSIVKGYAADQIYNYLININFKNILIDVGGNIITSGKNIGTNKNWNVGIQKPYTYQETIGNIKAPLYKQTYVTSGIYERYIVEKNEITNEQIMHHHILNPITGYPENNELLSVTIITTESIIADALSTAVFLMGLDQGYKYINNKDNIDAIFITRKKEIIMTSKIQNQFNINSKVLDTDYKIINYDLL